MNNSILNKAISIANMSINAPREERQDYLIQAQDLLLKHLELFPQDTEAWILLALLECNPPFYDPERIKQYTNTVLTYDKGNVYALLFLSYADYYILGSSDKTLINKLSQAKNDKQELLSLIEIAKARYWEGRNESEYEKCLLKSIEFCKTYVENYAMLGKLYIKQKKYAQGILLLKEAVNNITKMASFKKINPSSPTDMQYFLEEFFSGNNLLHYQLLSLIEENQKHIIMPYNKN